jgi:hypothetical protein
MKLYISLGIFIYLDNVNEGSKLWEHFFSSIFLVKGDPFGAEGENVLNYKWNILFDIFLIIFLYYLYVFFPTTLSKEEKIFGILYIVPIIYFFIQRCKINVVI